jgi:hypothetical protein
LVQSRANGGRLPYITGQAQRNRTRRNGRFGPDRSTRRSRLPIRQGRATCRGLLAEVSHLRSVARDAAALEAPATVPISFIAPAFVAASQLYSVLLVRSFHDTRRLPVPPSGEHVSPRRDQSDESAVRRRMRERAELAVSPPRLPSRFDHTYPVPAPAAASLRSRRSAQA